MSNDAIMWVTLALLAFVVIRARVEASIERRAKWRGDE